MTNYIFKEEKGMLNHVRCVAFFISIAILFQAFSQPLGPGKQKFTKKQIFTPFPDGKANAATKNNLPDACKQGISNNWMSFTKTMTPEVQHPNGSKLFSDDAQLGQLLTTFLTNLGKDNKTKSFSVFFTKIHLLILHQLYQYLTKIYTVFNMTHIDALVPSTDSNNVYREGYLVEGAKQALTRKTLIINHLINIVEAQSNGAIRARFPTLPPFLATYAGNVLMKHDYGADLTVMLDQAEIALFTDKKIQEIVKPSVTAMRDNYLSLFADYLKFFNRYTQTLHQDDTSRGYIGTNDFVKHAQRIGQLLESGAPKVNVQMSTQEKVAWLRSLKKLNPPMFFYDNETMRGLKIIPMLAKSLPKNVEKVPYPAKLVEDARQGTPYKPKFGPESTTQLAFFKKNRLYVNIPTMQYLYTQELLPQPDWLNSVEGIMKMLQVCLGDFSSLLDPVFANEDILDPCLECIVYNASVKAGLLGSSSDKNCTICHAFIKSIQDKLAADAAQKKQPDLTIPDQGGPSIPDGGNP